MTNINLLQSQQLSNYLNNLVIVRQTVDLYLDYASIRTSFDSGLIKEIAYITITPPNISIGPAIDNVQNVMMNSLYNLVYANVIQSDSTEPLYSLIITLISEMEVGAENSFAEFVADIAEGLED